MQLGETSNEWLNNDVFIRRLKMDNDILCYNI